jgi:hypothetical protein
MADRSGWNRRLAGLVAFGVAFGFMEASVVIYLRELLYPDGFLFPLALPGGRVLGVELGREVATLVMLAGTAAAAGRTAWGRFGIFAFLFGVWDLVYYLVLWAVLGWPESLFTWDVLFLLPGIWSGPVLSAGLIAVSLVIAGGYLMRTEEGPGRFRPGAGVWFPGAISLGLLLWAFLANHGVVKEGGVPEAFPWGLYTAGFLLGWTAFGWGVVQSRRATA